MQKLSWTGLVVAGIVGISGCSGEAGESLGEQDQALGGTQVNLAVFDGGSQTWFYDSNDDGTWTSGVDFQSAAGAFGGTGDIALSGYGNAACGTYGGRIGVYRPSSREFFLDANNDGVWNGSGVDRQISNFMPAAPGFSDQPIIWASDYSRGPLCRGVVGYFRTPNAGGGATWYIDMNDNGTWDGAGQDRMIVGWGSTGDIAAPLSDGLHSVATVYQPSLRQWIKDNGNGVWDGCGVDSCIPFFAPGTPAMPGTKPIANPNGTVRGVSSGTYRYLDLSNNGSWGAGDMAPSFGIPSTQPIIF